MSDLLNERTMQGLFTSMNQHIPVKRRTLEQLLSDPEPSYQARDGRVYRLDRSELLLLFELLGPEERSSLKLPILIMTDTAYGEGYWKVMGRAEVKALSAIIGREPEREDEMRVFYPYL
ncbi:MAG TPA: DUF61 family protein, partial [Methanomassiliicoccales archaeon]|nr:DUF61 family protein [Methanomassiliicoccales archaeon]